MLIYASTVTKRLLISLLNKFYFTAFYDINMFPSLYLFVCLFVYYVCYWCRRRWQADIHEHLQQRRSSYNIEYGRNRTGGSASKVDLLKSALEINHKTSHSSMASRGGGERTSNQSLNRYRADSAPKLNLTNPKSLIIPGDPVLEVIGKIKRMHTI